METLIVEYSAENSSVKQILLSLVEMGVMRIKSADNFESDLERAITGDELMDRMKVRIHKMFENECAVPARS